MSLEIASWLARVTRSSVSATARCDVVGEDGSVRERSEHVLEADDLLRWSYTARGGGDELLQSCDGEELVHSEHGRTTRTPLPTPSASPDDPLYFYSWPGVVDAWLVEMVRPVDLLARVTVSSISGDTPVRITARPLGNERSPYNGFSVPDGRLLAMVLDVERGCFTDVTVTRPGHDMLTFTLTRLP